MRERQSSIKRLCHNIASGIWKFGKKQDTILTIQDMERRRSSVSLPSPIESPISPASLALLEEQMPEIRAHAQEMFEKGEISEERFKFIQEVSVEGFAYTRLKQEKPDFNWVEWELGGSH